MFHRVQSRKNSKVFLSRNLSCAELEKASSAMSLLDLGKLLWLCFPRMILRLEKASSAVYPENDFLNNPPLEALCSKIV
jgi:hypothetical protein